MSTPEDIEVPVVPMTAAAFAPYGTLWRRPPEVTERTITALPFDYDGRVTAGIIWQPHAGTAFTCLERHFGVTQAFAQLSGAPSVVCVAAPTGEGDAALPAPSDVLGFVIDPAVGYQFHRGTWHSMDRHVLSPPGATFLILNSDPNPSQVTDFERGTSVVHADLDRDPAPRVVEHPAWQPRRFRLRL